MTDDATNPNSWDGDESDPEYQAELSQAREAVKRSPGREAGNLLGWLITVIGVIAGALAVVDSAHAGSLILWAIFGLLVGIILILGNRISK